MDGERFAVRFEVLSEVKTMHAIDRSTGKDACMVVGEPAWHQLGVVLEQVQTASDAIRLAQLDWVVQQCALFAAIPSDEDDGEMDVVNVSMRVANIRMDTKAVLGIVSPQYQVFQNRECFEFMDVLVDEHLAMYETAGALDGGRTIWMMARIPKEYRIAGTDLDDVIEPYALLCNSHDGTKALKVFPTSVRVVCQNTLNLAMTHERRSLSIYHRPNMLDAVDEARRVLHLIGERLDHHAEEAQAMAKVGLTTAQATEYFSNLFPTQVRPEPGQQTLTDGTGLLSTILEQQTQGQAVMDDLLAGHFARSEQEAERNKDILELVLTNFENQDLNPGHTVWSAFNSVSEWVEHQRSYRGKDEAAKLNNKLNSIWFGTGDAVKQASYQSALDLVA